MGKALMKGAYTAFRCGRHLLKNAGILLFIAFLSPDYSNAQNKKLMMDSKKTLGGKNAADTVAATIYFYYLEKGSCKGYIIRQFPHPAPAEMHVFTKKGPLQLMPVQKHLITVKGNILYDVNYRSYIDTPYAQSNVYQHTIQTYLDITWKDKYPFRIFLTKRFGNAPFLRNYMDYNLQYNPDEFKNQIKRRLLEVLKKALKIDTLEALKSRLDAKRAEVENLQNWIKNPAQLQKLVEQKERRLTLVTRDIPDTPKPTKIEQRKLTGILKYADKRLTLQQLVDSLGQIAKKDSLLNDAEYFEGKYEAKKQRLDSLMSQVRKLDSIYQSFKSLQYTDAGKLKKEIEETTSVAGLQEKLKQLHIADSALPKGYKTLFALKTFGIGKSIADYSELSAKNISITGVQAEYNPKYYYAIAAGTVDYRFRDYIFPGQNQQKQWLALARVGKGTRDGNHVIFTYYTGRRQLYNAISSQTGATATSPNYNLMGFTLESRFNISKTTFLTAELAKSSLPFYSTGSIRHRSSAGVFQMNDRSNEAWTASLYSFIPATRTIVNAIYRHTGSNFQSFSLFTNGSAQSAWSVRVEQPFFRRQLKVSASIRENDLINSFTGSTYKSNAVLKSFQATMRLKKWPILSIGYFPSSQLTSLGNGHYSENYFNMLSASVIHYYKINGIQVNTALIYSRFYNASTDSGFVYFNTRNLLLSHSIFLKALTLQTNISKATNSNYNLVVIDQSATLIIRKWLSLGAGIKYNRQSVYKLENWGYSGLASVKIPVVGELQLSFDKSFIPGIERQLVENNMGRLTYFKSF